MLLAAELALLAIDPASGRHALGARDELNACLAALLVGELVLDGNGGPGERRGTVVLTDVPPVDPVLVATAQVVAVRGPKLKAVMSSMDRSLGKRLGTGTWDAVVATLVAGHVLGPAEGSVRPRHPVLDPAARDEVLARVRDAGATDGPLDARTALVLAMTGPANLLELVAPDRRRRAQVRRRIDHALDASSLREIGGVVRTLLAEAATAAVVAATAATVTAANG
jgi:Golgi phosphoprotein 3 (GPP34)